MSWFFGKKKTYKDTSPDASASEQTSPNQSDDYIFVEKRGNLYPSINNDGGGENPSGRFYPPGEGGGAPNANLFKQNSTDFHSIINNIPFKLCDDLERNLNSDLDIDSLRINEISNFIKQIYSTDIEYNFDVENSVIAEMNCQKGE